MHRKRGFTLIELLVVIAIIGILATLVVTQLGTAQQRAKNSNAQSDITQGGKGIEIFKSDDTNAGNKVVTAAAAGGDTLGASGSASTATGNFATTFTGTLSTTSFTYGTKLAKTPGVATYTYKYDTPGNNATQGMDSPATVPAGSYILSTTLNTSVSGASGAFWVANGTSSSGASAPGCADSAGGCQ